MVYPTETTMNDLINEFINIILNETTDRTPGTTWRTKGGNWRAKNLAGNTKSFSDDKAAALYAKGRSTEKDDSPAPGKKGAGTSPASQAVKKPSPKNISLSLGGSKKKLGIAAMSRVDASAIETALDVSKSKSPEIQKRVKLLTDLWGAFVTAKDDKTRVSAITALAEHNLIEGHAGGNKIYVADGVGIHRKTMTGNSGTVTTRLMNDIIKKYKITVPTRSKDGGKLVGAIGGTHNEIGICAHLSNDPNIKNSYKKITQALVASGGNASETDILNKMGADVIRNSLPKGSTIVSVLHVGNIGPEALAKFNINAKVDPTDLIVTYENGKNKIDMKISAKVYTNPSNITMKNSGPGNAGTFYIGGKDGDLIDKAWTKLREKYKWNDRMSDEQRATNKSMLRHEYLSMYGKAMEKLSKTDAGQKQLDNMWKSVHGCGTNVHTIVTNKKNNSVELRNPDYYCSPQKPFTVKYDGLKIVIGVDAADDHRLEIALKTEDKKAPVLQFFHKSKKSK